MAKQFVCDVCGQEFIGDRESVMVEEIQEHAQNEHGMELEADNIRAQIEDT